MLIVLTAGTKNTRNRLTRLILQSWAEYYLGLDTILGWVLDFSPRWELLASPSAGALGFGWCSRLLLTTGGGTCKSL